jgi:hypothetical protein
MQKLKALQEKKRQQEQQQQQAQSSDTTNAAATPTTTENGNGVPKIVEADNTQQGESSLMSLKKGSTKKSGKKTTGAELRVQKGQ